jgi:hypothetical protein
VAKKELFEPEFGNAMHCLLNPDGEAGQSKGCIFAMECRLVLAKENDRRRRPAGDLCRSSSLLTGSSWEDVGVSEQPAERGTATRVQAREACHPAPVLGGVVCFASSVAIPQFAAKLMDSGCSAHVGFGGK